MEYSRIIDYSIIWLSTCITVTMLKFSMCCFNIVFYTYYSFQHALKFSNVFNIQHSFEHALSLNTQHALQFSNILKFSNYAFLQFSEHTDISCLLFYSFQNMLKISTCFFRWFKFTLKPPYSIAHDKLRLAIWDTSFWTFWLKFGHKGP